MQWRSVTKHICWIVFWIWAHAKGSNRLRCRAWHLLCVCVAPPPPLYSLFFPISSDQRTKNDIQFANCQSSNARRDVRASSRSKFVQTPSHNSQEKNIDIVPQDAIIRLAVVSAHYPLNAIKWILTYGEQVIMA